jgi:hypothetical protein
VPAACAAILEILAAMRDAIVAVTYLVGLSHKEAAGALRVREARS